MDTSSAQYSINMILAGLSGAFVNVDKSLYHSEGGKSDTESDEKKDLELDDIPDILKFSDSDDHPVHIIYTRLIPSVVSLISFLGGQDIYKFSNFEEYTDEVKEVLYSYGLNRNNAWLFIDRAILATRDVLKGGDEEKEIIENEIKSYLDSSLYTFNTRRIISIVTELFNGKMNRASMSALKELSTRLGLSAFDVTLILEDAGYTRRDISFPSLNFSIGDYPDVLDFSFDPIDEAYGSNKHLAYCRIAPALATLLSRLSFDTVSNEKEYVKQLNEEIEIPFSYSMIRDFVNQTVQKVLYMERADFPDLELRLRMALDNFSDDEKLRIVKAAFRMMNQVRSESTDTLNGILGLDSEEAIADFYSKLTLEDIGIALPKDVNEETLHILKTFDREDGDFTIHDTKNLERLSEEADFTFDRLKDLKRKKGRSDLKPEFPEWAGR